MNRKTCAFCGRDDRKISNEHAWPNWTRDLFPAGKMKITSGKPGGDSRHWTASDHMGVTVNCVCKPCNEGWMQRLELSVMPILSGPIRGENAGSLNQSQQTAIAAWAYKTAMVFEFAGHTDEPYYTAEERQRLMATVIAPPRYLTVSIATYEGATYCTAFHHFVGYDVPGHPTVKTMIGHSTTITLGRFAVQVFGLRADGDTGSVFQMPIRTIDGGWNRFVTGIWPNPRPSASWPVQQLTDRQLVLFMNRWNVGPQFPGPPVIESSTT